MAERAGHRHIGTKATIDPLHTAFVFDVHIVQQRLEVESGLVERALQAVPGVQSASVNLATERAEVIGTELDRAALVQAQAMLQANG